MVFLPVHPAHARHATTGQRGRLSNRPVAIIRGLTLQEKPEYTCTGESITTEEYVCAGYTLRLQQSLVHDQRKSIPSWPIIATAIHRFCPESTSGICRSRQVVAALALFSAFAYVSAQ